MTRSTLEYFDGIVRDSRFESAPSGDPNGDGLDLHGSRVVVVNNELTGAADKAASVGEQSEALFVSNRVGHSAIGVAVKDLSSAYLHDNRFEENRRDVRAYLKKPFFGGGRVVFVGAGPREADLSVDIDERSTLTRMQADAVERLDPTGMRPERVVDGRVVQRPVRGIRGPVSNVLVGIRSRVVTLTCRIEGDCPQIR